MVWSHILDYENSKNPFQERREQIAKWRSYSESAIEEDEEVIKLAAIVNQQGIKKIDSLHVACAIKAKAKYFLTTDDGVLTKMTFIQDIQITDPIMFYPGAPRRFRT